MCGKFDKVTLKFKNLIFWPKIRIRHNFFCSLSNLSVKPNVSLSKQIEFKGSSIGGSRPSRKLFETFVSEMGGIVVTTGTLATLCERYESLPHAYCVLQDTYLHEAYKNREKNKGRDHIPGTFYLVTRGDWKHINVGLSVFFAICKLK